MGPSKNGPTFDTFRLASNVLHQLSRHPLGHPYVNKVDGFDFITAAMLARGVLPGGSTERARVTYNKRVACFFPRCYMPTMAGDSFWRGDRREFECVLLLECSLTSIIDK